MRKTRPVVPTSARIRCFPGAQARQEPAALRSGEGVGVAVGVGCGFFFWAAWPGAAPRVATRAAARSPESLRTGAEYVGRAEMPGPASRLLTPARHSLRCRKDAVRQAAESELNDD
jgi:hypothetical protein